MQVLFDGKEWPQDVEEIILDRDAGPLDLAPVPKFPKLKTLTIPRGRTSQSNVLPPLSSKMETLHIPMQGLSNLTSLIECPRIRILNIESAQADNWDFLDNLTI